MGNTAQGHLGDSREAKLLVMISKQLDQLIKVTAASGTTTTTTTLTPT